MGGVYSLDEQYFMKGRVLTQLPKRIFCLKRPDQDLQVCYTPPLNTALPSDDRIYEEQSDYFAARSFARSFGDAVALIEDREARLRRAASCEISAEEDPDEFAPL